MSNVALNQALKAFEKSGDSLADRATVLLYRLPRKDYEGLMMGEILLTDLCPEQVYYMMIGDTVIEVAPEITSRMRELFFKDV